MRQNGKNITLEDIFLHKRFEQESFYPFEKELPISIKESIEKYLGKAVDSHDCIWNEDKSYLLFSINRESIYRRSSKENVFSLDIKTNEIHQISDKKVSHATFSPNGKMVAYVLDNNLFVYFLEEKNTVQVTDDGKWNHVINGNCDWVYEEEFAFSRAYEWSPDSEMIAYFRFDESLVKEYSFPIYDNGYNTQYSYKYPKAGEENASVSIWYYHIESKHKSELSPKSDGGYIPKIVWSPVNKLNIFHLNRHQNELRIWENYPISGNFEIRYSEKNERYIDLTEDWFFLQENQFVFTSEQRGFRNIYVKKSDRIIVPLTENSFDLSHIVAIDKKNSWIYFVAAYPNPMVRHLFVVDFQGNQKQLSEKDGWNEIHIDLDQQTVIIENSNTREPTTIDQYKIILEENQQLPTLQYEKNILDNTPLKTSLSEYTLGQPAFMQIPIDNGERLNGWMLLPHDFDEQKQYPLLFCNYGGPGSQTVLDRFGSVSMWHQYLSQNGLIVVSVDNTGTGFRGEDFKKKTYLQLGKLEIEDQIKAAEFLTRLPYVDSQKIGHWGWSFGGFMSCLAITKGASIFSYAVAIAPVTSWKYYDTIYTERYMRTPQENEDGYENNSPFHDTSNIKGQLLLIHGSADDNVHLQHTMQFSKHLAKQNIPFEMAIYPDKNHRITGGNTQLHLFHKITKWLLTQSS